MTKSVPILFPEGASPVPINWDQIKEFAQDVQELRQDSLKYGQ